MTKAQTLIALAERLEGAEEGSRGLDAEAWYAAQGGHLVVFDHGEVRAQWYDEDVISEWETVGYALAGDTEGNFKVTNDDIPPITTDLTASVRFCEEHLPGWSWFISNGRLTPDEPLFAASVGKPDTNGLHTLQDLDVEHAASVCLALTAATLRAMAGEVG